MNNASQGPLIDAQLRNCFVWSCMSLCQSHFHRCCLILLYIGHFNADIVSFGFSCPCAIAYNDVIMQYYCCNIYVILITDIIYLEQYMKCYYKSLIHYLLLLLLIVLYRINLNLYFFVCRSCTFTIFQPLFPIDYVKY